MTVKTPPVFQQGGSYVAQDLRQMIQGQAASGVIHPGDFITSAGGGMSVNVGAGTAFVAGTETVSQGTYFVTNDAPVNLSVAASDPTNARNDLVILRVRDAAISGAFSDAALVVVTGVASGTPVDPAIPADSVVLARLVIPALAAPVIAGYIQDIRQMAVETWPSQATTGLVGAQNASRAAGATTGGAPTTGTYAVGDTVVDRLYGLFWVCTGAGTPGTWMPVGTGNLKARMHRVAALSITAGSFGVIPFDTVTYDPHGNMTTGAGAKYTCPLAGKYLVTGRAEITNAADRGIASIFKNGVEYARGSDNLNSTTSQGPVGDVVDCAAGDTLDLRIFATTGPATGDNGAALMFMSVAYQGA